MRSDCGWLSTTWGDIAELRYGKALKGYREQSAGYPVYGTNGPVGFTDKPLAAGPAAIVGRKGAYRGVHLAREPFWVIDTAFWLEADRETVDPVWAYYSLKATDINSHDSGSAIPSLSRPDFYAIPVVVPPLGEQRAIAEVLGALDDRINYLHQRVRLALETLLTWYDLIGASTFPVAPFGSIIGIVGGGTPSTKQPAYWGGEHYWITPRDLSTQQSPVVLGSARTLTDAGINKIGSGLLPEGTVLLSSRAPIGYVAVARVPLAINQGFIALPPSDAACPSYLLGWLHRSMDQIKARAGGSTFAEISKRNFKTIDFPVPGGLAYDEFRAGAGALLDLITEAEREREATAQLRDSLLPRLLSGQVRIDDPKQLLEPVA